MAADQTVAEKYAGYDTFQQAMVSHAEERKSKDLPPQDWNAWQKEAAEINRAVEFPDGPSGATLNSQYSSTRKLVNAMVYGGDLGLPSPEGPEDVPVR